MTYKIVVADEMDRSGVDQLSSDSQIAVVNVAGDSEALKREIVSADALLVRSATQVTAQLLSLAEKLKVVGRAGIGVDNIDLDAATHRGIAVVNAPGANTVSAAEHTVALLMALLRRVPEASTRMREGGWDRKQFAGTELRGKTLGALGLGRVGSHAASILKAFGMRVVAYDPFLPEARAAELGVELADMDHVIANADVLTLHMPLTDETAGIMDARHFAMMKKGAVLVNTARGGLIDEDALVEAVKSGQLRGAALDVFVEEPLGADSALRTTPGILVTPHLGASTAEAQERVSVEICNLVRDALLTGDVRTAVNIPGVAGASLARLKPLLELTRRAGKIAASLARGRVTAVDVSYSGNDDDAPKPVQLAAIEGTLSAMGISPVSLINASVLAQERGIQVSRKVGGRTSGSAAEVEVTVAVGETSVTVRAALDPRGEGRIVGIDDYDVDFPPEGALLVLRNKDVPGVIGRVGTVLGGSGVNIGSYHQARVRGNDVALAAITVDAAPDRKLVAELEEVPDVTEVRFAKLD